MESPTDAPRCRYKGSYRGCPVAIKKPLDLQFGRDPKVLADFSHEVDVTRQSALSSCAPVPCLLYFPSQPPPPPSFPSPSISSPSSLSELRHPNIVLLMGACLQPPNLFIVMEWSEGGSLFSLLHQSSRAFDLRAIVRRPSLPSSQMRRTV